MFDKKENLIGLDIGSSGIKVVRISTRDNQIRLLSAGWIPASGDAFSDGKITKPELLSDNVQQIFNHLKIKGKAIAAAVSGYEVMIKKIELPAMTSDELDGKMQSELGQYIPYKIEDVDVDYQILGATRDRPTQMDVLLVAAKKDSVRDHVAVTKGSGSDLYVVDVDFFALGNAFEAVYGILDRPVALLDIGASKGQMCIISGGVPIFTRVVPIGGAQITQGIRDKLNISFEDAEQIKLAGSKDGESIPELEEVYVPIIRSWVGEFKRAVDFYYSNYPDKRVDKMYLCGGSCRINGLDKVMSENIGFGVEIFNPFSKIECDEKIFDQRYLDYIGPRMAIAFGLALRKTKEK